MSITNLRMAFLIGTGLLAAGCAPYVNIPPQAGDVASHNANLQTVQNVAAEAVKTVLADRPIEGNYTLVLPPGTLAAAYEQTLAKLGEQATTIVQPQRPIIEVRQMRVRADRAEVDLVRPANSFMVRGPGQLVTVYLRWEPFIGWASYRLHGWNIAADIVEPDPDYAAPPPAPQPAAAEPAPETAEPAPLPAPTEQGLERDGAAPEAVELPASEPVADE